MPGAEAFAQSKACEQLLPFVLAGCWHITGKNPCKHDIIYTSKRFKGSGSFPTSTLLQKFLPSYLCNAKYYDQNMRTMYFVASVLILEIALMCVCMETKHEEN